MNKITVLGNPTISDIKVIMIGVRNNSRTTKSAELWVNELRLTEFNEDGGWAGNANLFLALSDLGTLNFTGRKETAGFGGLDQGIMERNLDDMHQYNVAAQIDLGRFFPKKAKINLPLYYSYREELVSPKYNPLDGDILLSDAIDAVETKAEKDSIKNMAQDRTTSKSIGLNGVRVGVGSKTPMPYDPANISISYTYAENSIQNATTQYDRTSDNRLNIQYSYSNPLQKWKPFKKDEKRDAGGGNQARSNPNLQQTNSGSTSQAFRKFLDDIEISPLPNSLSFTSDISRTYYEYQLRDIANEGENMIPPSFREDFYWNRSSTIQWDITKNLRFNFNSNTNSRIESPHVQVNKQLFPDEYQMWKDSVIQSLQGLGSPMDYNQKATLSYSIPFRNIPLLSFITATLKYDSDYDWKRGATIDDETVELGNEIQNRMALSLENVNMDFVTLYNKSEFLRNVNQKFGSSSSLMSSRRTTVAPSRRTTGTNTRPTAASRNKKFETNIVLLKDSNLVVNHNLNNKRLRVTATGPNNRKYEIKFKAVDANSIRIQNRDSIEIKLSISQLPPIEEEKWYKIAQVVSRGLMFVRNATITYSKTENTIIPNFRPEAGDFFGQGSTSTSKAPGWDFAFGLTGVGFMQKAADNGWIVSNTENINPALNNKTDRFTINLNLEPFPGMRIKLNGDRTNTQRNQYYLMYDNMPPKVTGDFTMTTISLRSGFGSIDASNGYYSETFQKFLDNRQTIAQRLENYYGNQRYPNSGFITESGLGGQTYNPANGSVNLNSTDVLIPAFLAAYTGKSANSVSTSAFPSLKNLLPNWDLTYDGLMKIPFIANHFKSFSLRHKYTSIYNVGSYNSYLNWVGLDNSNSYGFSQDMTTGNPYPTSLYDITNVTIKETFDPLFEINSTFTNNASLALGYTQTRNVTLNVSAYQISEALSKDFRLTAGYRFDNFNRILKMRKTGGANFNNEMKFNATLTYHLDQALLRKIEDGFTQAISGQSSILIKCTAEYALSKMVSISAYYDRTSNRPLVSSTAYPISKSNFGIDIRISLTR